MGPGPLRVCEQRRDLPREFHGTLPPDCERPVAYLPGTLVVQGTAYAARPELAQNLAEWPGLGDWPLCVLVDDSRAAVESMQEFLWTVFTRFEPAADIHAKGQAVRRFHVGLEPPIVFDCRMKPWYTEVLEVDDATRDRVDRLMPLLSL